MNIKKVLFLGLALITAHNSCAMETVLGWFGWTRSDQTRTAEIKQPAKSDANTSQSIHQGPLQQINVVPQDSMDTQIARFISSYEVDEMELTKELADTDKILADQTAHMERRLDMEIAKNLADLERTFDHQYPTEKFEKLIEEKLIEMDLTLIDADNRPAFLQLVRQRLKAACIQEKATGAQKIKTAATQAYCTKVRLKTLERSYEFYHKVWKKTIAYGLPPSLQVINRDVYQKMLDVNKKIEEYNNLLKLTESRPKNIEDYLNALLEQQGQERETRKARLAKKQGTENNSAKSIQAVVPASPSAPLVKQHAKADHRPQRPEFLQKINAGNFSLKATPAQVKSKQKTPATVFETALDLRRSVIDSKEEESGDEN